MKYSYMMAALAAPVVLAAPAKRQSSNSTNIDTVVLQFALTLEHLENVFYKGALQKFSQADFLKAGYGADYYNNLRYIATDEQSHVQFLQAALTAAGQTPVAACTYNFPYTDVNSFITLSSILEGVGTSAYLGGAPLITNKNYLTAAGSILVTEALHTSYQRAAVNEVPFANPYGTPLDPTSVYTLASAFIKSCPQGNQALPFTPFPSLTLNTTAGTCEEPDCSPKIFEKRGWESWTSSASSAAATETGSYSHEGSNNYEGHDNSNGHEDSNGHNESDYNGHEDSNGHNESDYNGHEDSNGHNESDYNGHDNGYNSENNSWGHGNAATTVYVTKGTAAATATVTVTASASSYYTDSKGHTYPAPTATPSPSSKNLPALQAGSPATFTAASPIPAGSFLTFVSGLMVVSVPASINGNSATANIPTAAMGQTYVFVTKTAASGNMLDGSSVLFGPAILEVTPQPPSIDYSQS